MSPAQRQEGGARTRGIRKQGSPQQPLVSVVTVAFNAASSIEATIRAVLEQTYPNIEYIVIDGGSTDGTLEIIRGHSEIDYWLSEPDAGLYDAMNKAVRLVTDPSAYVIFANADDRLHSPDAISRMMQGAGGADLVYGRMLLSDGNAAALLGHEVGLARLARETLCHPATLVRRSVFDKVGFFDTGYRIAADYDFIVRCFTLPVSTVFVDQTVATMGMGGLSEERFMLSCRERMSVVRRHFRSFARLAGLLQVSLYDLPRHLVRRWLRRAGLLGRWRALKNSQSPHAP